MPSNPDIPEGNFSRYVFGLKIFEGSDGEGGGTISAQAQILDPTSTLTDSRYIDVGMALDLKALANGVNTAVMPNFTFDDTNNYVLNTCLLYTSPSPRDRTRSRMPSSA